LALNRSNELETTLLVAKNQMSLFANELKYAKENSSSLLKEDELLTRLIEKLSPSLLEKPYTTNENWKRKKNVRLLGLYIPIPHLSIVGKTIIVLKCYGLKLNPWVTK
jgi:hypothetical protein